jgi:hypothetical protein
MFRVLTTSARLRCSHMTGTVQLGPGAAHARSRGAPILRQVDVLHRPVSGCKDCRAVTAVNLGAEECWMVEDSPVLTELAHGTANAGTWFVEPVSGWAPLIGLTPNWLGTVAAAPRAETAASQVVDKGPLVEDDLSPLLHLRAWRFCLPHGRGEWRPDPAPPEAGGASAGSYQSLAGSWLYVFRRSSSHATWLGEHQLAYTMPDARWPEQPPEMVNAYAQAQLAGLLLAILDKDSQNKWGLRSRLARDGATLRAEAERYTSTLKKLARAVELASQQLCARLESPLWELIATAHRTREVEDFAPFLEVYAECIDRLLESKDGEEYLSRMLQKTGPHFIRDYAVRRPRKPSTRSFARRRSP